MVDTSIFGRLKRLFSTDVIIRNVGGNQLKVIDTNHIQSSGKLETNNLMDRFNRVHLNNMALGGNFGSSLNYQAMRVSLYNDYEVMDTDAIIASALDIVADECTLKNESGEILVINSADENTQKVLYNLFYDILNIEFNLWSWIRTMCKYGDAYLQLHIAEDLGVYNVTPLSTYIVNREEGLDPQNPSKIRFRLGMAGDQYNTLNNSSNDRDVFENYEVAHFRLLSDSNFLPYGKAFIEPARKEYKKLSLMEDAMMIHRIMRAPEKRVFYMNVGSIPANDVDAYMEIVKSKIKKTPYIDERTGDYNLKYNMQNINEDFFVPMRGNDSSTKIDTLKGLEYNAIEDVIYLRDKTMAALKVPKAFYGYEKDLSGKATLAAEDIRFARTIERIQRIVVSELYKIALVHLVTQGFTNEQLTSFELTLTTPSIIYDQERVALLKEKTDLATSMLNDDLFPTDYIYKNIFKLSEDQYDEIRDLMIEDKKRKFRLSQIENEGNDPSESGKSYGTPHDLASSYGRGRMGQGEVPKGYDETDPVGRPQEKSSKYSTQDHALGKDPIGGKEVSYKNGESNKSAIKPLAMENKKNIYNKQLISEIQKANIFAKPDLLDESNIKEEY